jgi:hypothetical protein
MKPNYPTSFPKEATSGDLYRPAMEIRNEVDARAYFKIIVDWIMDNHENEGKSREEIETITRSNLGYYAGYYSAETRLRVEKLFECEHPIFGSIAKNGSPTPEQAFKMGQDLARKPKESER